MEAKFTGSKDYVASEELMAAVDVAVHIQSILCFSRRFDIPDQ